MVAISDNIMITGVTVKGYFEENCYFYIDDQKKHGFLIDPGAQAEGLLRMIRKEGWTIEKILLTHGHFDHTGAVNDIRKTLGIPVYAYEDADMYLLDTRMNLSALCGEYVVVENVNYLKDGDVVRSEANLAFSLKVLHTPGHTPDSVIYYSETELAAFVGDTIFQGSIGNWQYPGGNFQDLQRSILETVFSLPDNTKLYSGHSDPTNVGTEKRRYNIR